MDGFIDLHCHVLPGLDDGAQTMEESLTMLRQAEKAGFSGLIMTPHHHIRRGMASPEQIKAALAVMQEHIDAEGLSLRLYPGNELYYAHDSVEKLSRGEVLTLAGSNYVLTEFSFGATFQEIRQGLLELSQAGYYPVLAHIERYECMTDAPQLCGELYDMGVYIQVNAGSFLGDAGRKPKKLVSMLLKEDLIHFVGTDAHDTKKRSPEIERCVKYIKKKAGEETVERLLRKNAQAVLENRVI